MKLTKDKVLELFNSFKQLALRSYKNKRYDLCLKYLSAACYTAYTFYLGYTDQEIEDLLKKLAGHIIGDNGNSTEYCVYENKVVFFDTFAQDTQGLTMQYLKAIIAGGYEVMFLTGLNLYASHSQMLRDTLDSYPKATIVNIPSNLHGMARAQYIYEKIYEYHPGRLIMHIFPSAVVPVVAFNALPKEIVRYQINLTDHTFWVGTSCTDYSFEFREYGANLSIKYREIPRSRILFLPYYPVMKQGNFAGFPQEADDKIKIFSGASYYKIIDENDTFFKLNKAILDANPEAVTLFAGGGDKSVLDALIDKYGLRGRFIPIGQRNDIFECYKHSDIYLSTYPLFGGLMGQYAAHASLPILALEKKGGGVVEEVICQKHQEKITLPDIDEVVAEATRLIKSAEYRNQRGAEMKCCVIDKEEFDHSFRKSLEANQSQYSYAYEPNVKLHYLDINDKLKLINKNKSYQIYLFHKLGSTLLWSYPKIWKDGLSGRIKTSRLGKYFKK